MAIPALNTSVEPGCRIPSRLRVLFDCAFGRQTVPGKYAVLVTRAMVTGRGSRWQRGKLLEAWSSCCHVG